MFKTDSTDQPLLFAFSPRDMLPVDSDVFLYIDLFDSQSFEDFDFSYSCQGQSSVEPKLMLRTILYGLTHGISSCRKLAIECQFDNRYIVLSGGHRPSYRNFARFIERHTDKMDNFFTSIVRLAQEMGLVSLGRVAIDGTRIKANTTNRRTLKYEQLERAMKAIKEEISALRASLDEANHLADRDEGISIPNSIRQREVRLKNIKKAKERLESEAKQTGKKVKPSTQISVNDPDSRSMASNKMEFIMGYNCQSAVDEKNQIILAADIHDASADRHALEHTLNQAVQNVGATPAAVLFDSGYESISNYKIVKEMNSDLFTSFQRPHLRERLVWIELNSDGQYHCRSGLKLKSRKNHDGGVKLEADSKQCTSCVFYSDCAFPKTKNNQFTTVSTENYPIIRDLIDRMRTKAYQAVYRRRKAIVEPVFGNIKSNKGIKLYLTTKRRVSAWWKLVCGAHNIEKIIKATAGLQPAFT